MHFSAPEVIQNSLGGAYDTIKADIWSCGIMLYIMVFGQHPFIRAEVSTVVREWQLRHDDVVDSLVE